MMLTTDQISNAMFTPVSKGAYSADEVDSFLKKVAESYEQSLQDNKELIKKISILADKIESYRNDEEAIKLALLDAHRLAETINKEANAKAESKIEEAESKSRVILDGANRQSAQMIDEAREKAKEIVDNARVAVSSLTERAQNETEQAITAAQQKATEIVLKAEAQGKEIIGTSKADYEYYSCELERIKKETAAFMATIESLCKGQMELLAAVPAEAFDASASVEAPTAEPAVDEIIAEIKEEPAAVAQELSAAVAAVEIPEPEEIEAAAEEIEEEPASEPEAAEESIVEEEIFEEEILEVPEAEDDAPETEAAEEEDDLFSMIEELNFEDIVSPDAIPATLEEAVAEAEEAVEDDDEEEFSGFKIDLDELEDITSDTKKDEEDITSLFDSFFNE